MTITIRLAQKADALPIARLHFHTWRRPIAVLLRKLHTTR